mmetsp:Transcript_13516/g.22111  ORF Transcript_13516/g.22111 Transcript_13516/m.22111 type:complete len:303 (+) Transcript_13516:226-1134(+)|eukprot:jgi/Bigna1/51525/estExt_Genewise1Plus.C_10317
MMTWLRKGGAGYLSGRYRINNRSIHFRTFLQQLFSLLWLLLLLLLLLLPNSAVAMPVATDANPATVVTAALTSVKYAAPLDRTCKVCGESFVDALVYRRHLKTHRPLKHCPRCGKTFTDGSNYAKHVEDSHHEHKCNICNKTLSSSLTLLYHRSLHNNDGKYQCDVCRRRIPTYAAFTKHLRKHTGEKPYRCRFCNKTMADSSNLAKHERKHTQSKPYKCEVCNMTFTDRSNLVIRHLPLHFEHLRRHKCKICGRRYAQKTAMASHARLHRGWAFQRCDYCGETGKQVRLSKVWRCAWCVAH